MGIESGVKDEPSDLDLHFYHQTQRRLELASIAYGEARDYADMIKNLELRRKAQRIIEEW